MIYATMCVGDRWNDTHQSSINNFSKNKELHTLTDLPDRYENSYFYKRDVFSYYEKINHIVNLLETHKQRVTYIDVDWLGSYDKLIKYDSSSLYTYWLIDTNTDRIKSLFNEDIDSLLDISKLINIETIPKKYIPEALISIPYIDDNTTQKIKSDFLTIQNPLEKLYGRVPRRKEHSKWSKNGIGYGEGWAISLIASKYNLPLRSVKVWGKKKIL